MIKTGLRMLIENTTNSLEFHDLHNIQRIVRQFLTMNTFELHKWLLPNNDKSLKIFRRKVNKNSTLGLITYVNFTNALQNIISRSFNSFELCNFALNLHRS